MSSTFDRLLQIFLSFKTGPDPRYSILGKHEGQYLPLTYLERREVRARTETAPLYGKMNGIGITVHRSIVGR